MNILLKYHIRKEDEKYSLDEKCWMIYPPPEIAKSDLPSNRLYDLPSNHLWRFTPPPKLPSLTYPQIVFGDLLPFKCEVFEYIVLNIKNS